MSAELKGNGEAERETGVPTWSREVGGSAVRGSGACCTDPVDSRQVERRYGSELWTVEH